MATIDASIVQFRNRANDSSVFPITKQTAVLDSALKDDLTTYVTEYNISIHKKNQSTSENFGTSVYTLEEAIANVPEDYRRGGLKLMFLKANPADPQNPVWTEYALKKATWSSLVEDWEIVAYADSSLTDVWDAIHKKVDIKSVYIDGQTINEDVLDRSVTSGSSTIKEFKLTFDGSTFNFTNPDSSDNYPTINGKRIATVDQIQTGHYVSYDASQGLSEEQKRNARENIGAGTCEDASTAEKLKTPRSLWGNLFDGTADIIHPLTVITDDPREPQPTVFRSLISGQSTLLELDASAADVVQISMMTHNPDNPNPYVQRHSAIGYDSSEYNGLYIQNHAGHTLILKEDGDIVYRDPSSMHGPDRKCPRVLKSTLKVDNFNTGYFPKMSQTDYVDKIAFQYKDSSSWNFKDPMSLLEVRDASTRNVSRADSSVAFSLISYKHNPIDPSMEASTGWINPSNSECIWQIWINEGIVTKKVSTIDIGVFDGSTMIRNVERMVGDLTIGGSLTTENDVTIDGALRISDSFDDRSRIIMQSAMILCDDSSNVTIMTRDENYKLDLNLTGNLNSEINALFT